MSKRSNRSNRTTDSQDLPTNISERCKFTIKFNSTNISTGNYIFMSINIVSWWIQMHCYSKWIKQAGHAYCKPIILPVHCSIGRKRITSVTIIIIVAIILIVIVIIVLVSSLLSSPWSPWRPWSPWSLALRPPWSLSLWSPWSPWHHDHYHYDHHDHQDHYWNSSLSLVGCLLLVIIGIWTLADKTFLSGKHHCNALSSSSEHHCHPNRDHHHHHNHHIRQNSHHHCRHKCRNHNCFHRQKVVFYPLHTFRPFDRPSVCVMRLHSG